MMGAALWCAVLGVSAQRADSVRVSRLDEARVVTNRATNRTPLAFSNLDKKAIERVNFGQDIPFLLSTLPSVVTTSDAGNGIGYTSIRVRGTVGERINVTNNGIPLNDPEAHTFYWVDTPDLVSSVNDIQLQRGVGTSTNGAAAFGASINMTTDRVGAVPYASVNSSFGSFATTKNTVKVGTGLLANHWAFDTRLSYLASDGYRDRASARLGSYFFQGAYLNEGTTLKFILFGGREKTYHAWDGISREQLTTNRTYNPNGAIGETGQFYKNQIDFYFQQHAQVLLTQQLTDHLNLSGGPLFPATGMVSASWDANLTERLGRLRGVSGSAVAALVPGPLRPSPAESRALASLGADAAVTDSVAEAMVLASRGVAVSALTYLDAPAAGGNLGRAQLSLRQASGVTLAAVEEILRSLRAGV